MDSTLYRSSAALSMSASILRRVTVMFRGSKPREGDGSVRPKSPEGRGRRRRRVRFADRAGRGPLVTEVRTRPTTPRRDVGRLFYIDLEIERFRRAADIEDVVAAAAAASKASWGARLANGDSVAQIRLRTSSERQRPILQVK